MAHMTTYERAGISAEARYGRFGRHVRALMAIQRGPVPPAKQPAQTRWADYEVDPHAVADAIVTRLLAGRGLVPGRDDGES